MSCSSVTPKYVQIETDLVANLIESCSDSNPVWLDQNGKVVGIIARIWDQAVYLIGLVFNKEISKIEDNFASLCRELGKNGSEDPREVSPVIVDLITLKKHDQAQFVQVTNAIYNVATRILTQNSQASCNEHLTSMMRHLSLAELDVVTVPANIAFAERAPGALFNLNHNTCYAIALIQFLANNPLFNQLLAHAVTRKPRENFIHFLIREEIQQNLRGLLAVMHQELQDEVLKNEQVYIHLYLVLQRIRFLSKEYPRSELKIFENHEDIHDFLTFLFEILQCEDQQEYTFARGTRRQVKREAGDEHLEDFTFATQPMQQPIISIGERLREVAKHFGTRILPILPPRIKMRDLITLNFSSCSGNGQMRFEKWETNQDRVIRDIDMTREFLIAPPSEDEEHPNLPPHLMFHINRFSPEGIKDSTFVDLGIDRVSEADKESTTVEIFFHDHVAPHNRKYKATYELISMACHLGEDKGHGHYYAVAQRGAHPMIINDTSIRRQRGRDIQNLGKDVYLVLYRLKRTELIAPEEDQSEAFYRNIQEDYQMVDESPVKAQDMARTEDFLSLPANRIALNAFLTHIQETGMTLEEYFQMKAQ